MKTKLLSSIAISLAIALSAFAAPQPGILNRSKKPAAKQNDSAKPAAPDAAATAAETSPDGGHALNWDGAPSDIILMAYGDELGKTILIDPACPKGVSITLKSPQGQSLSREDYLEAIRAVLEQNGIHLEPYKDSFIRALPRKDARKEGIPLIMDHDVPLTDSVNVVSMMIPFENMTAADAQKVLEGFKSNSGLLIVFERTNKILVTDTEQNIRRMVEIARAIDVASPATEQAFVRQIKNASVQEVKTVLEQIVVDSQKWQEKDKAPANAVAQQSGRPQAPWERGRPGLRNGRQSAQQQQQQAEAANNESLVMSVSDADRGVIRGRVTIVADERSNKLVIITSKSNMDFFDKVIEQLDVETTPDTVVKVYRLKYADSEDVSDMINDLIGNAPSSKSTGKNSNQNAKQGSSANMTGKGSSSAAAKKPANQRTGEAKPGELSKENTTVLADKRINGIVVMTNKELVPTIEQIIESMDIKLSQVLIETVIIEVQLGDDISTGIDWVNNNWTGKDPRVLGGGGGGSSAEKLTTLSGSTSSGKTYSEWASEAKSVLQGSGTSSNLSTDEITKYINAAKAFASESSSVTPVGAGITYFLKSEKLNLSAIIEASKSDSRSKYIASPVVMTVDNKEATIEATQLRYLFKGYQYSGSTYNGSSVPDYEQKDIGITVKVTPKINPNGTVMLTVEEEYSQEGAGQMVDGVSQATTVTRKMSADVLLENMQTVVLGGLTQRNNVESTTGIPILKDIPWVGKWLFGSVTQTESRNELLVFMTPYVLADGEGAQMEAIRRKKSMSDPSPWEDNGWSGSALADPVSKKEQLRRLQDEWKKQDAERQTRLAIEQEKVKRAQKLKGLTVEERNLWLKMHKDELEEEAQEELEEKMLDDKSQEELKKLAAEIRAKKLAESEKELKKAEEETAPAPAAAPAAASPTPEAPETPASAASILGEIDAM